MVSLLITLLLLAASLKTCTYLSQHLPQKHLRNENIRKRPPPYTIFSAKGWPNPDVFFYPITICTPRGITPQISLHLVSKQTNTHIISLTSYCFRGLIKGVAREKSRGAVIYEVGGLGRGLGRSPSKKS